MFCPKCGTQNPDGAAFCSGCGNQLTSPSSNAQRPVAARPVSGAAYAPKKSNNLKFIIPAVAAVIVIAVVAFFMLSGGNGSAGSSTSSSSSSSATTGIGSVQVGDTVTLGTYEQDNNTSNGQEAIEWQVLDVQDGKALLISKYALDCQQYNTANSDYTVAWDVSSLRTWMNSTFYAAAFTSDEQSKIVSTTLTEESNSTYSTTVSYTTTDKVFCLSIAEVEKYMTSQESRVCTPTAYAVSHSYHQSSGGVGWWLRSMGRTQEYEAYVSDSGSVGGMRAYNKDTAVRPAMWVTM